MRSGIAVEGSGEPELARWLLHATCVSPTWIAPTICYRADATSFHFTRGHDQRATCFTVGIPHHLF